MGRERNGEGEKRGGREMGRGEKWEGSGRRRGRGGERDREWEAQKKRIVETLLWELYNEQAKDVAST